MTDKPIITLPKALADALNELVYHRLHAHSVGLEDEPCDNEVVDKVYRLLSHYDIEDIDKYRRISSDERR